MSVIVRCASFAFAVPSRDYASIRRVENQETGAVTFAGFVLSLATTAAVHFGDLAEGLSKSFVFGAIVASVSCLRGLQTGEGPRAVGESTTRSVVSSILLIILADTIIASVTYTLRK